MARSFAPFWDLKGNFVECCRQEHEIQGARAQHLPRVQWGLAQKEQQEYNARGKSQPRREGFEEAQLPSRKQEAQSDRQRALEDHGSGYVPEGQGILVFPEPDHGVELLGQLRRQGSEYQGDQTRRYAERL